ncbi:hypothetical protein DF212_00265 [Lactobacillus johnsonii]|nr:hypothetical protein DF212_00265 [Lactobacillus johnsonii]
MSNFNSINNGGVPYYFPADIAKEGQQYARFSNWLKTRVNDNGKKVPVKWYDQGRVMNVNGLTPFIQGMVGHFTTDENDELIPSSDVVSRDWQGSTADVTDGGLAFYTLEDQFFCQEGQFKGVFGLRDSNGNVYTSVNIIFEILGNDLRIGETTKYYSSELEKMKSKFANDTRQAVKQFQDKYDQEVDAHSQALIQDTASLRDLAVTSQKIKAQLDAGNFATTGELVQISNQIRNSLAKMRTTPEVFANLKQLQDRHPDGKDGIFVVADTGHMYIWANESWVDSGPYQSAGLMYQNGLLNLVGFPLVSPQDICYGNVFETPKYTDKIWIKAPNEFYIYNLATDGSGDWKYNLLKNDKSIYYLDPYDYLVADIDNNILKVVSDGNIKAVAKDLNLLILGYNDRGELKGPILSYSTSQKERLADSWETIVSAEVVISSAEDNELIITLKNDHFLMYSPKKYAFSKQIIDSYQFSNVDSKIALPNYGILALDLSDNGLKVYDYHKMKNDTDNNLIVVGYNSNGTLLGMWEKYQNANHFNSLFTNLWPTPNNSVIVDRNEDNALNVSWSTQDFIYNPAKEDLEKSQPAVSTQVRNDPKSVTLKDSNFLIFNTGSKMIETYAQSELSGLNFSYIVLGYNSNGKLLGNWHDFSSNTESNQLPDYYFSQNYLQEKVNVINRKNDYINGVSFYWLTDLHLTRNAKQSPKLLNYLQAHTGINTTFCGGDLPPAYGQEYDILRAAQVYESDFTHATDNFFAVRGNHDFTIKQSSSENVGTTKSNAWTYNFLQRQNEKKLNLNLGKEYWYYDNPVQKVRYIGLDTTPTSDTSRPWGVIPTPDIDQAKWLINTLNELPKDYKVIVFSHIPLSLKLKYSDPNNKYLCDIISAFANHRSVDVAVGDTKLSVDFSTSSGKFIAAFSGHTHLDEDIVDDNVLHINTSCDAMYNDDPNYTTKRTQGTTNEQCFDAVSVNFDTNTITCVRIGAGAEESRFYSIPK